MMKMKKNKEIQIKIEVGTNMEMSTKEFENEINRKLNIAENTMNSNSKIRFHLSVEEKEVESNLYEDKEEESLLSAISNKNEDAADRMREASDSGKQIRII